MNPGPAPRGPRSIVYGFLVLGLFLMSCGRLEPRTSLLSNQSPEITLDRPTLHASGEAQRVALTWKGSDSDGRVDHYMFASDPRSVDRVDQTWTKTGEMRASVSFPRGVTTGRVVATGQPAREEPHVFAVRAVDDQGAMSAPATMALFGTNIAPQIFIESPQPNPFFIVVVPPSLDIRWRGQDQDGQITKFKYRLFTAHNPDFPTIPNFIDFAMADPDSFRRLYEPNFSSWDSVGPDTQSARYTNLIQNEFYLFAIVAFDDAGDYSPVFSAFTNMLKFAVSESEIGYPLICVSSQFFSHCPPTGRLLLELDYELPAEIPIEVNWFAQPSPGTDIEGYRWVLDPKDPADEKPRTHPTNDPNHWTPWSLANTSATVSRQDSRQEHALYIQARDGFDRVATVRIDFTLAQATPSREILVVDDTRLTPDQLGTGGYDGYRVPMGLWPTAAELDTFLYARGGVPWRANPPGTMSTPGLLDGYDFDTLGTRGLPNSEVPLSLLTQYRQVIWMTDAIGATYLEPGSLVSPMTSLRRMSSPGSMSTLAAYVAQGGKLWLCGGGAALASLTAWNRRNTPPFEFTNAHGELVQGRLMYDYAHWRSAVTLSAAGSGIFNHPSLGLSPTSAPGRGWPGQPNYNKLLATAPHLLPRSFATDPPPPLRFPDSFYYVQDFFAEFLSQANRIIEDVDSRPNHEELQSTLDTIYVATGYQTPAGSPVMTYYHGSEGGSVVFSGFPIWHFQRSQCAALVDFVIQDIWGLARQNATVVNAISKPPATVSLVPRPGAMPVRKLAVNKR